MIATRFVPGVMWLLLSAAAQGTSGMTYDRRTIMEFKSRKSCRNG